MKAELPTEEDVLAMLVLFGAKPLLTNACSTEQLDERDAWNAAVAELNRVPNPPSAIAYQRVRNAGSLEAAIADSERRLEVERIEREVLFLADQWEPLPPRTDLAVGIDLADAARRLRRARAEVSRHGG